MAEKQLKNIPKGEIGAENNTKNCQKLTLESQAGALKIVRNLEDEVLALQKRLQESEKSAMKLQRIIKEKNDALEKVTRKNHEYREKVGEAVEVVHAALNEKDAALFREKEAKGKQF